MATYYGYARISSTDQSNFSIRDQETFLRRRADELGLPFEFRPEVGSGTSQENRRVFMALLEEVVEGDCLGVAYHDRFGRGGPEDSALLAILHNKKKVRIDIAGRFYDPSDAVSTANVEIMMVISKLYSGLQAQKARQGIKSAQHSGKYLYKSNLYGYRRVDADGRPHILIDEAEAGVIRLIMEKYKAGHSYPSIQLQLEHAGYRGRSGRPLSASFIRKVMMNPVYMGYMHPDPPHLPGRSSTVVDRNNLRLEELVRSHFYPAIIAPEVWWNSYVSRRVQDSRYQTYKKYQRRQNEVTGVIRCGYCGKGGREVRYVHAIHQTITRKGLTGHYPIYTSRIHLPACPVLPKSFKAEIIERLFRMLLILVFERPAETRSFVVAELQKQRKADSEVAAEVAQIQQVLKKKERQRHRLLEAISSSEEDVADLVARRDEVMGEISELSKRVEAIQSPLKMRRGELEVLFKQYSFQTLQEFFAEETLGSRRRSIYLTMLESATQWENSISVRFKNGKHFEIGVHRAIGKNYQVDFISKVSFESEDQGEILLSIDKTSDKVSAYRLDPQGKQTDRIPIVDKVFDSDLVGVRREWDAQIGPEDTEAMQRPIHVGTLLWANKLGQASSWPRDPTD